MSKFMRCNMDATVLQVNARSESGRALSSGLGAVRIGRMRPMVQVTIHSSQFPENVQRALLTSLRTRRINHKFLYDGVKKTQKWLALHEAYSPARSDTDCVKVYERAFAAAASRTRARHL